MSYAFQKCKKCENRLRFDKVAESIKVELFWDTVYIIWRTACILDLVVISGAVYELNKSYDQVFIVIGGVYVVDALVFGAAAMSQSLRLQRRRFSATTNVDCRRGTTFQLSDFHLTSVNSTPAATVSPLFSTYGTVMAKAGTVTGQPVGEDGDGNGWQP